MPKARQATRGPSGNNANKWPTREYKKQNKPRKEKQLIVEHELKFMYFNTNHLNDESFSELVTVAANQCPDFMAIAETWLYKEQVMKNFPLKD